MKNKPKHTLEDLFSTINETLEIIQNHKGPINMTPELLGDIDKLEAVVADFKENNQILFETLDIDIQNAKKEVLESTNIRSSDKQLIKRSEDIEKEARVIKHALSKAKSKIRGKHSQNLSSSGENKQKKERRKLFKPLGGDKTWIPL